MLERHGGAVRADLARWYGRDLDDVFTGAMLPDDCWDLVVNLPRDSAVMAALASDPDFARPGPPPPPSLTEFGPQVEVLAGIYDLIAALVAGLGKTKVDPYPRPVTASAKAEKEAARRQHRELVKRLTGGG